MGRGVTISVGRRTTAVPSAAEEGTTVERVGVLGGTFDPPHMGHLWLATLAADAMQLDRVLFMPAAQPPHKPGGTVSRATDRLLMTRLAIAGEPRFEICPLELERPGPSYTVDSLEELRRIEPQDTRIFLVMASDSLSTIDTWREPDRVLELAEWIVGPRPDAAPPDRAALVDRFGEAAARIHLLEGPSLAISSTAIRARVAAGRTIGYLVPRAVEELILERRLYRT